MGREYGPLFKGYKGLRTGGQDTILKFLYAKKNQLSHTHFRKTLIDSVYLRGEACTLSQKNLPSFGTGGKADEHDVFASLEPIPSIGTIVS